MLSSGVIVVAYITLVRNMTWSISPHKPFLSGFETDSTLPNIFCCQYIQVQFRFNLTQEIFVVEFPPQNIC
jgi:hypothetical protein